MALILAVPVLPAQDASDPGNESPEHVHARQPAWKSVEIGDFYLKRQSYRAALSRYKDAVKTDPYYPEAYLGLGKVYDYLGLRQKALENYEKYLDLLPSSKQADEAGGVHKAIARLKRKLKPAPSRDHPPPDSSPSSD